MELPGVKEPERVRKLLQGTASLEFWTTFESSEIYPFLAKPIRFLPICSDEIVEPGVTEAEDSAQDDIVAQVLQEQSESEQEVDAYRKANPLFSVLQPSQARGTACIGYAEIRDTAAVNRYLSMPQIKDIFPLNSALCGA